MYACVHSSLARVVSFAVAREGVGREVVLFQPGREFLFPTGSNVGDGEEESLGSLG